MATLTETAFYTRKGVKVTIGLIIGVIVLRFLLGIAGQIWLALFPPPPPPATMAFGLLPKLSFPKTEISSTSAKFTYTLETVDGGLPKLPGIVKVYFVPKPSSSFGGYEKMIAQATRMGFTTVPQQVYGVVDLWTFTDPLIPLRHLEFNATTGFFRLYYDYRFDLNLFANKNFESENKIISDAISFFGNFGLTGRDLLTGRQELSYFKLNTTNFMATSSIFDADSVRVNLLRADIIDNKTTYPIVMPDPAVGNVTILFSGNTDENKKILEAKYNYQTVDYENFATYPAITVAAAMEMLKSGQGYIASAPKSKTVSIRNIYLAYYDPGVVQSYLQPVIVFSDGKDFKAYVPAIPVSLFQP
ncbi:MAG: hypothetical protein Q7S14_02620 [bacterium]|nr:hypothetical protein [bacterium]